MDFLTLQQAIAGSSAAGSRAGLTLFVLGIAGHFGYVDFPPELLVLTTLPGLAGLFGLAVVEQMTERDEDMQDILEYVNYGMKGLAGGIAFWSLSLMPESIPSWVAVPLGFVIAGATHHYRMKLYEALRGAGDHWLSPRTYVVALETGGTLGVLVALLISPPLALGLLVFFLAAGWAYLAMRRALERTLARRDCPHCGSRIRKEASRCHSCGAGVPVVRWLADTSLPVAEARAEDPSDAAIAKG